MASPRVGSSYRLRGSSKPFRLRGQGTHVTGTGAFLAAPAIFSGTAEQQAQTAGLGKRRTTFNTPPKPPKPRPSHPPAIGTGHFHAAPASFAGIGYVDLDGLRRKQEDELLLLLI